MLFEENKVGALFEKAKLEEPCISSDEVLAHIASEERKKLTPLKHVLKLKVLLNYAAAAAIIAPVAYILTSDEPAPKKIVTTTSPSVVVADSAPNLITLPEKKTAKFIAPEKPVNLTENLKSLEHISIENENGTYVFYFKNDSLVITELNGNKLSKKQLKDHKPVIDYANQLRKSYKEFESSVDYNSSDFKQYMLSELKQRGIVNDSAFEVRFNKSEVSIDSLKIDNAIINEIIAKYKSGILK
ncbi:MAG TPA: hypothetical protein PKN75_02090 [Bacteroidia bacterium]|nr:hypothetical protein [Bacteroidia bacterium]HNU32365.1 hypothetical protein [Bacteroidia bacterium]